MFYSVFVLVFSVFWADCINLEGQLTVIKKDCYERLAIGEKLSANQIYKRFEHNTVTRCEQECTEEKDKCRAYSFGIGTKGNGTCLLSNQMVKETVDLKPIGTIHDPEYDLYIKKIDCQIVLEPPKLHYHSTQSNDHYQESSTNYYPSPPVNSDHQGVINTLVSIASGPNSVLHPNLDILVSGDSLRPHQDGAQNHHDAPAPPQRPDFAPFGVIDRRKYESSQHSSFHSETVGFSLEKPVNYYDHYSRPSSIHPNHYASLIPHPDHYHDYQQRRPQKPLGYVYPRPLAPSGGQYEPGTLSGPITEKPVSQLTNHYGSQYHSVSHSVGSSGERVTAIITELPNACFRRTMAGSRTVRSLVRKLAICETVEQCQKECGDERQFTCEGFNYRLDATGQGKGTCELLDLPLSRLDLNRDILPDQIYDLYTRDRNCGNYYGNNRQRPHDRRPTDLGRPLRPIDRWEDDYVNPPPRLPPPRPPPSLPNYENRRGDYSHHYSHESHSSHSHHHNEHTTVDRYDNRPGIPYKTVPYLPAHPKRYPLIIQLDYRPESGNRLPFQDQKPAGWQYGDNYRYDNPRRNYYIPAKPLKKPSLPEDWGQYGGSYGTGTAILEYKGFGRTDSYDYWGLNRFQEDQLSGYNPKGSYLPLPSPAYQDQSGDLDNSILPPEPPKHFYNKQKDECSLRSSSGFRLHKQVVRKILTVADIYECELLCVVEKSFSCSSYAFRYTSHQAPIDNCHLSPKNYKELDYYTDLEPDREFDVYTMNNRQHCTDPHNVLGRDESDCFWRVRSGQRLDESVVCDSLTVKSAVDCQIECLRSYRFVCRSYSFRYGSPVIGGAIDNCQLTDWPSHELNPRYHFVPEPGFEIYRRESYGHGCETGTGTIGGTKTGSSDPGTQINQLCYAGFGSGSKLLEGATVKYLEVPSELDCKLECSKARESGTFSCVTLSFQTEGPKNGPNCRLSDITQRDLLPNVDFIHDPNTWLFSWDNSKPECANAAFRPLPESGNALIPSGHRGIENPLDVWKVYSVSGWPCQRGTKCQENHQAGFWYCNLEGGGKDSWDYCCSPDHQCGLSNGYSYSWCYVGPSKTQWRKCSDQYYPYNSLDRFDGTGRPWESTGGLPPPPHNSGFRPDRFNGPVQPPNYQTGPNQPHFEQDFNEDFLNPPKPGGFGPPKRWPVAYLHKELPPNVTDDRASSDKQGRASNMAAIKNLIHAIQRSDNESQAAVPMTDNRSSVIELSDGNLTARVASVRSLNKQFGYRKGVITRTNSTAGNNHRES